jgi:alpha-tubulin suppressor-like RCC1 family protein
MEITSTIFERLSDYFQDNIKLSFIANIPVLIIITKDDRFYQFCEKTYLPIAKTANELQVEILIKQSIVEELCNKNVADIKMGLKHYIARTLDGKVYDWGDCGFGYLGNKYYDEHDYKPKLNEYLDDLNIIDISCGSYHNLVLASTGDIYGWGFNDYGQTGNGSVGKCQSIPFKINYNLPEKFKAISCGSQHSMALTEDGRVFSWGYNLVCQLGVDSFTDSNTLLQIDVNNIIIEKISCGYSHSLLLSNEGEIYVAGNYYGTDLDGNRFRSKAQKVHNSNKFCDIATNWCANISAALSKNGIYYVWGQFEYEGDIDYEPIETSHKSFNEIFIKYLQMTYKPIEGKVFKFETSIIRNNYYQYWFEEKEKLGEGSYGEVFKVKGYYEPKNRSIAMKKITLKNEYEKEFLKELEVYRSLSKIRHKNVLYYYDSWVEKNCEHNCTLYIKMELCAQTLSQLVKNIEKIEFEETVCLINEKYIILCILFIQILKGVNYLHKQIPPIIHRDLYPDNILLKLVKNDKVVVKIADYGLVTIHKYAEQTHKSDVEHIKYIAPEVRNGRNYDKRADIYSLGLIIKDLFNIDSIKRYYFSFIR